MSGRVKKLLHLQISTIILLFCFGGDYPLQERKIFFRLAHARHNYPPTCKYESAPLIMLQHLGNYRDIIIIIITLSHWPYCRTSFAMKTTDISRPTRLSQVLCNLFF